VSSKLRFVSAGNSRAAPVLPEGDTNVNWMDRLNERAELMGRMLDTIGAMKAMPTGAHTDVAIRTAAYRCINCSETEACRTFLENHLDGANMAPPDCPNAQLFNSWLQR
jgi:hypothetical protein